MIVRNNASAVKLFYKIIDSSAENLTGLKQSTDIVLVKNKNIKILILNLGSRTISLTNYKIVFHYF